jgi:hypothetical protein
MLDRDGYGFFVKRRAHRFSYAMAHGEIPAGLLVLHECDNPACVRPDHLRAGTNAENLSDMRARGRHPHGESHAATRLGEKNGRAKLTAPEVVGIREAHAGGESTYRIAIRTGLNKKSILDIVRRRHWKHVA